MMSRAIAALYPTFDGERRWRGVGLEGALFPAARRLDLGDVDLPHVHHRVESALGLGATGGHRLGQHTRRDLPRQAPFVLAPAAHAFLAAILDDRVPQAIRLRLILGRDLE